MTTDFRALCVELIESVEVLLALRPVEARPLQTTEDRLSRARAALADELAAGESVAVVKQPTYDDLSNLCSQHGLDADSWPVEKFDALWETVRTVLARWGNPAPAPPADGEVAELVAWLEEEADDYACIGNTDAASKCNRAVELLQRLSPPQPVPVSERLPGPEDCDANGRCWWLHVGEDGVGDWLRRAPYPRVTSYAFFRMTHWLPAYALPVPGQEVEG